MSLQLEFTIVVDIDETEMSEAKARLHAILEAADLGDDNYFRLPLYVGDEEMVGMNAVLRRYGEEDELLDEYEPEVTEIIPN